MMVSFSHLLAAVVFSSSIVTTDLALAGQAERLPPEHQCLAKAYVLDPSQKGLNVRQKPNLSGKILARLPKSTEINVLGMQGQWLLISAIDPVAQKVAFRDEGWVYGSLLGVSSTGYEEKSVSLYSQPSFRSRVVGNIPPNSSNIILGCSGKWLKVKTQNHRQSGWLAPNRQCAAAYTTCS
jgi:Bacterial SH3 domain